MQSARKASRQWPCAAAGLWRWSWMAPAPAKDGVLGASPFPPYLVGTEIAEFDIGFVGP